MAHSWETLRRLIVVLFSLNPCICFEIQVLLLRNKEKDLYLLSTLTLLVRIQTEMNHSHLTKYICKQQLEHVSFFLCIAGWQLMGRTVNSFEQLMKKRQSNTKRVSGDWLLMPSGCAAKVRKKHFPVTSDTSGELTPSCLWLLPAFLKKRT